MIKTKVTSLVVAAAASLAFAAPALASPEFGRGMAPSSQTIVSRDVQQVSPLHPNFVVGGQGMPAFGRRFTTVTTNEKGLRDRNPGYRGFISDGR